MRMSRSPAFWGVVAVAAVGAGALFYRRRSQLLGRGSAGPTPKLILRNPAKMPVPNSVTKTGERTLAMYQSPSISIDERLKLIQKLTWDGAHDPRVRQLAFQLTASCGRDDGMCEAQRVFDAVKRKVRYSGDRGSLIDPKTGVVEPADLYQSAMVTWSYGGGDCDDATILIGSLLSSIGHTVRLRVGAESRLADWSHIWCVTVLDKDNPTKAYAVDVTLPYFNAKVGSQMKFAKARDYTVEVPA